MNKNKVQEITEDSLLRPVSEAITPVNNIDLGLDELIEKIDLLAQNKNPYTVSKEMEELKSIFYLKLKAENKEEDEKEESEEDKEETNSTEEGTIDTLTKKKILHPLEIKFKLAYGNYKKIKFEFRKERAQEEGRNLKTKRKIIEDIDKLTQEDESIKKTFEHFKILQEQWRNVGHVPQTENNNLWQSYHHHVELFYDYIKLNNDLRDLDFTRNLEEKTKICEKAEALVNAKSFNKMHDTLQELHEHWKNIGPVKRELREDLWERFQNISKTLNKKRNDYFLEIKEKDKEKRANKDAICKKIDDLTTKSITSHNTWQLITKQSIKLEEEWRNIGRLNKVENTLTWKNLRTSLNNFYNKKNAFYKQKKEEGNIALAAKISICEKAETLQDSTDWQGAGNKLIVLQAQWKNAGFTSAEKSNKLWKRFKAACNTFFNARKAHYKAQDKKKEACFKEKTKLLKEVKAFKTTADSKTGIEQLKEFGEKWKALGHVPIKKMKINEEFFALINSKFETLGLSKKALENEKYKNKISSLKGNDKAVSEEKRFLREKIDILKKETAQYENNISFLGIDKGTEPLRKQVEKQISIASDEIDTLKQKLQLLSRR